jgi:hypothetical protein
MQIDNVGLQGYEKAIVELTPQRQMDIELLKSELSGQNATMLFEHNLNISFANPKTKRLLGVMNTLEEMFSWYGEFSLGDPVTDSRFEIKRNKPYRYNLTLNSGTNTNTSLNPEMVFKRNNEKLWHVYVDSSKKFHIENNNTGNGVGIEIDYTEGFQITGIVGWTYNKTAQWFSGSLNANTFFVSVNKTNTGTGLTIDKSANSIAFKIGANEALKISATEIATKIGASDAFKINSSGISVKIGANEALKISGTEVLAKIGANDALKVNGTTFLARIGTNDAFKITGTEILAKIGTNEALKIDSSSILMKSGTSEIFKVNSTGVEVESTKEIKYKGQNLDERYYTRTQVLNLINKAAAAIISVLTDSTVPNRAPAATDTYGKMKLKKKTNTWPVGMGSSSTEYDYIEIATAIKAIVDGDAGTTTANINVGKANITT